MGANCSRSHCFRRAADSASPSEQKRAPIRPDERPNWFLKRTEFRLIGRCRIPVPSLRPGASVWRHHQAPDSTFDGTLIGDMSLDKSPAEESSAKGLAATSSAKRRINDVPTVALGPSRTRTKQCLRPRPQSTAGDRQGEVLKNEIRSSRTERTV